MKPEVMAKAETMMITGYQRELTYRRGDGSFSAFGENDQSGSLAHRVRTEDVRPGRGRYLRRRECPCRRPNLIVQRQNADGSFDSVGFVHDQELLGGLQGKTALTAYVAAALKEAGETAASSKAASYLEGKLDTIDDAYTLALLPMRWSWPRARRAGRCLPEAPWPKTATEGCTGRAQVAGPMPQEPVAPPRVGQAGS